MTQRINAELRAEPCIYHPRYQGKRPPRTKCTMCEEVWRVRSNGPHRNSASLFRRGPATITNTHK